MKTRWVVFYIVVGVVLAFLTLWLWPAHKVTGPVTCTTDENCGGTVLGERFCKDGSLFASGQENTCLKAGTSDSVCQTTYGDVLVAECENGCANGACL